MNTPVPTAALTSAQAAEHSSAILENRVLCWTDEAACEAFAQQLAAKPELADAVIELEGPLGAGKTTFVRHLLRALGVSGRIKSPTYAVVESYSVAPQANRSNRNQPLTISHFDFYRFTDPREWEDAGFRDIFAAPGLKLCEWAEKVRSQMPAPDLRLVLAFDPDDENCRQVSILAFTEKGRECLG